MSHSHRIAAAVFFVMLGCSRTAPLPPPVASVAPPSIELRLAATHWPPFTDVADKPRVALDLVATALERAGYAAKMEIVPEGTLTSALQDGRFDGSAAMWRSEDREQFLLYSNAYLENRLMLVGPKGSTVDAASFAALPGKRIGIVESYAYGPELDNAKEPVFVKAASTEDNFRALLRGEVDYVLADALVIHHLVQQYPEQTQARLAVGQKALFTRTLHVTIRKDRPDAERIIERVNRQLADMLSDGSYHRALEVDWIHADIDGDGRLELIAASEQVGEKHPGGGYQVTLSSITSGATPTGDSDPGKARFVIKGVYYDTWEAVPKDYKTPTNALGSKPATLRLQLVEF